MVPRTQPYPYQSRNAVGRTRGCTAHVAEFCSGWMPLGGAYDVASGLREIETACTTIGRDPASLSFGMFYSRPVPAEALKKHGGMGATRGILPLPSADRETVLPILDEYARLRV